MPNSIKCAEGFEKNARFDDFGIKNAKLPTLYWTRYIEWVYFPAMVFNYVFEEKTVQNYSKCVFYHIKRLYLTFFLINVNF